MLRTKYRPDIIVKPSTAAATNKLSSSASFSWPSIRLRLVTMRIAAISAAA